MLPDVRSYYQALKTRDLRFDGRFFVGVSSTRIYCRPVCAVKTPKVQNCSFFPSAAAAESAGYRPCLRCRPELAPGNSCIDSGSRLAQRAASMIEDGLLNGGSVEILATRLGITDRHLRRVLRSEFGVSPVELAQTHRLLMAKRLLTDTALPVIEVAMASGFQSLRRFNALFRRRYRMSPSDLRRRIEERDRADGLIFDLSYRPPLDWTSIISFLGHRSIAGVEQTERGIYRRTVRLRHGGKLFTGWICAEPVAHKPVLRLTASASLVKCLPAVLAKTKHLFDLSCNPTEIGMVLGSLAADHPGLRVPGAFDGFELAVRAILGQQITVQAARTLAGRFAAAFGDPVETPFPDLKYLFPHHDRIAALRPSEIVSVGVTGSRAKSIVALARAVASDDLLLEPGGDIQSTLTRLRNLPGIGDWTAQYIMMRALSWPDAFPHTDYGVKKALRISRDSEALALAESWRPWRAYAALHLWKSLEER
jgi:AraC family transcriptional regulator of adaptative response / DNA-3-methyladenine glycosylase II